MGIRNGYHWLNRPLLGAQLDWAHPLARGLVACYLLNENAGAPFDLTGQFPANLITGGGLPWSGGSDGPRITNNNSTGSYRSNSPAVTASPCTFVCSTQALAGNNGSLRYALAVFNVAINQAFGVGWSSTNGTPVLILANGSSNTVSGPAQGTGVWTTLAAVFASTTSRTLYVNGKAGTPNTASLADPASLARTYPGGPGSAAFLSLEWGYIYNRALSAAEISWLTEEPYAFIQAPTYRRWFVPAATPAGNGLLVRRRRAYL